MDLDRRVNGSIRPRIRRYTTGSGCRHCSLLTTATISSPWQPSKSVVTNGNNNPASTYLAPISICWLWYIRGYFCCPRQQAQQELALLPTQGRLIAEQNENLMVRHQQASWAFCLAILYLPWCGSCTTGHRLTCEIFVSPIGSSGLVTHASPVSLSHRASAHVSVRLGKIRLCIHWPYQVQRACF